MAIVLMMMIITLKLLSSRHFVPHSQRKDKLGRWMASGVLLFLSKKDRKVILLGKIEGRRRRR